MQTLNSSKFRERNTNLLPVPPRGPFLQILSRYFLLRQWNIYEMQTEI